MAYGQRRQATLPDNPPHHESWGFVERAGGGETTGAPESFYVKAYDNMVAAARVFMTSCRGFSAKLEQTAAATQEERES